MNSSFAPQIASVSDLQRHYAALIKQAKESGEPVLVLKKNKPEVVILDAKSFAILNQKVQAYEELKALDAIEAYEKEKRRSKLKKLQNIADLFT